MGGILASANIDALKHKDFWQGVHVAIFLAFVGLMGVVGAIDGYVSGSTMAGTISTVWGLKTYMARKEAVAKDDG